jgi:superoxide dismutase, Fe-Mn family
MNPFPTRKTGVALIAAAGASSVFAKSPFSSTVLTQAHEASMTFTLPALPFAKNALEPHMSENTFDYHHGKHHQAYITKLNELLAGSEFEGASLEKIITETAGKADKAALFNNAAQHWNHSFFWRCLKPAGGGKPTGELAAQIDKDFGSYEAFVEAFKTAATTQFGSGWAWLVQEASGKLAVTKTANADLPLAHGQKALLTVDVWEHAYYLDFQNKRPDFVSTFLDKLANWEFAAENFKGEGMKIAA